MVAALRRVYERDGSLVGEELGLLDWARRYLCGHTTKPWSALHVWLAGELDRLADQRGQKINAVAPRGAAKSTLVSLVYVLRCCCESSEPYIWLLSDTKGQAQQHLANVRQELESNERLRAVYGGRLRKSGVWTAEGLTLAGGVRIEAYGAGQRIRGRRRGANRPTLIIGDDLQNDSHVTSSMLREKSRQWWWGTVLKAGRSSTNVINVGTALHRDAIAMELLRTPGWRSRLFRSIERWPERMDLWLEWERLYADPENAAAADQAAAFFRDHHEEMQRGAQVLWPEEEDLYRLMRIRVEEGHTAFEREKQNSPIDPERCEWPEEYFAEHVWFDAEPSNLVATVLSLDPSKGRQDKVGDWSAYVVARLTREGVIYVDCELARENVADMLARGVRLWRQWRPAAFGIESAAWQHLLAPEFARQFATAGLAHVEPSLVETEGIAKAVRIRRLGPLLSQRRLRFRRSSAGAVELVNQLRDFPIGAHDDGPDALEMAVRLLEELLGAVDVAASRMALES